MSKWTQDPTYPRIIIDEDRQAICEILGDSARQAAAFTRLIAEAPAMAELLESAVTLIDGDLVGPEWKAACHEFTSNARALLERINK